MTIGTTHEEFLAAIRVLDEGRRAHSVHEIADAKRTLKPIVRYQWPQIALISACFVVVSLLGLRLLPMWPDFVILFAAAFLGALAGKLIMRIPTIRPLFVPAGFKADDVLKASRYASA